jgi:hypothetical protein
MRIGFAKNDITPRAGVELCGFGPYLNRHSVFVRDRLWARAMALEHGGRTILLIGCDLVGVDLSTTRQVRQLVHAATGLADGDIMLHCTHTHSGPSTIHLVGWGEMDPPYMETLPHRIARAAVQAHGRMAEATLSHATGPCEKIGVNREYEDGNPPLAEVLRDDWRPQKPELTDTICHVVKAETGGKVCGFLSYFGCHPVVCCQETRYIHGDFAGVATNLLEREMGGAVGLFLQGAQGDVNSCVVHKNEQDSLLALDVIAARYASSVRSALAAAKPMNVDAVRSVRMEIAFRRIAPTLGDLRKWLGEKEAILHAPDATDASPEVRMAAAYAMTLRQLIAKTESGQPLSAPTELQGFRIGPLRLLGTPLEIFHAIKEEVVARTGEETLVMGITNDMASYAPDRTTAARGGYAAQQVPMLFGQLPYEDIHGELVESLVALAERLA